MKNYIVSAGIYKPASGSDRNAAFAMLKGGVIHGGFDPADTEDTFKKRNWVKNPTVLSGNIASEASGIDNAYHVF